MTTGTIFHKCTQILAYADDLVITRTRIQDAEETLVTLRNQTKRFGLEINKQKTKFMRLRVFRIPYNGGANITFATYEFEVVSEFTYLGTLLKNNNDLKPEIEKKILLANRAYYAQTPILNSHDVHRAEKIKKYINLR